MDSAGGTSRTKPDSTEDSEDMSQEGEDTGEREVILVGRIGEESTRPSCPRASPSVYLVMMFISVRFRATSE